MLREAVNSRYPQSQLHHLATFMLSDHRRKNALWLLCFLASCQPQQLEKVVILGWGARESRRWVQPQTYFVPGPWRGFRRPSSHHSWLDHSGQGSRCLKVFWFLLQRVCWVSLIQKWGQSLPSCWCRERGAQGCTQAMSMLVAVQGKKWGLRYKTKLFENGLVELRRVRVGGS